ncbi:MAG: hypothetical protein LBG43_03925 [Treponema sp.]|jgi:hypothetical protein|nr:hypothetical protein [Treponema sp.]
MRKESDAAVFASSLAPLTLAVIAACGRSLDARASKIKRGTLIPGVEPKVSAYLRRLRILMGSRGLRLETF